MENIKIDMIMKNLDSLKIKMTSEEFANFALENELTQQDLDKLRYLVNTKFLQV